MEPASNTGAGDLDLATALSRAAERRPVGQCDEQPDDLALVARLVRENPEQLQQPVETEDGPISMLHLAAALHLPGVVAVLLKAGAVVDARDRAGGTPLFAVLDQDFGEVTPAMERTTEVLIEHGADPDAVTRRGQSPAGLAAYLRDLEPGHRIYQLLAERPAGTLRDLNTAVRLGDVASVRALLAAPEAIRNAAQPRFLVAEAMQLGQRQEAAAIEILSLLFAHGVSADTTGHSSPGCTPLFEACGTNKPLALIQLLLALGADVNSMYEGETPLDVARNIGRKDLAKLLVEAGGKSGRTLRVRGTASKRKPSP